MAKTKSTLAAPEKAVDPALAELFSSSAGPIQAPPKFRYAALITKEPKRRTTKDSKTGDLVASDLELRNPPDQESDISSGNATSEEEIESTALESSARVDDGELHVADSEMGVSVGVGAARADGHTRSDRRRKRKHSRDVEDLEAKHLRKLAGDAVPPPKRQRAGEPRDVGNPAFSLASDEANRYSPESVRDDASELEEDQPLVHETLRTDPATSGLEKAARTVFLSNVSTDAITSRKAKKALLTHLSTILSRSDTEPQSIESIRFRSIPFTTAAIPKRAAFITKSLMSATTKSANAYVVFSDVSAARQAVARLNGTVVLDRHLRVDSVAHPSSVDHRRCVFVGNLGFVDDETVINVKVDSDGNETTEKRKRTKLPMDVEEGLWRVFSTEAGKVESVRVVRDAATRVGKGFAYVQFYDPNSVEAALLLTGKKFPPMLPRELRVSRCKAPHKTARALDRSTKSLTASGKSGDRKNARSGREKGGNSSGYVPKPTAEEQTLAGRAGKWLGKSAAARLTANKAEDRPGKASKPKNVARGSKTAFVGPEDIVFEGRRASAKDGKPKDLRFRGRTGSAGRAKRKGAPGKPTGRGARRAAKWKAQAGGT